MGDGVEVDLRPCPTSQIVHRPPPTIAATVSGSCSMMSPASRPGSRQRLRRVCVNPCGRRGRPQRFDSRCQHCHDHASQHVARPGCGEAFVTAIDDEYPTVGIGHQRRRALQQHDASDMCRKSAGGGKAIGLGGRPREEGVLAVVRSEDRRTRAARQQRSRAVCAPRRGVQRIAIDDDGQHRVSDQLADRLDRSLGSAESWPDSQRAEPRDVGEHLGRPVDDGDGRLDHLVTTGHHSTGYGQRDETGTGAERRLGTQPGSTAHRRASGDDAHRAVPLVRAAVAARPPFCDV